MIFLRDLLPFIYQQNERERELIFFQDCNICQKSRIENWADFLIQMFSDLILNFNLLWNISTAASISSCSYCDIICYRRITLSRIFICTSLVGEQGRSKYILFKVMISKFKPFNFIYVRKFSIFKIPIRFLTNRFWLW